MKVYIKGPLFMMFVAISMVGCNQGTSENILNEGNPIKKDVVAEAPPEEKASIDVELQNQDEAPEVEPLPSTYEELANQPIGEHVNFSETHDIELVFETFKDLPDISSPTDSQLDYFYRELLRHVQKEFKGPEDLMKRLRFEMMGSPDIEDSRYHFKENLNVEIILDASGSMAGQAGGKVKMEAAKNSITSFLNQLPADANVGLRIYGHQGSGKEEDKALSCGSSELVYPISPYHQANFQAALDQVKPAGWTPIELALNEAKKDLENYDGKSNTNIVYLVSDGVSTCDDDPIQAAKELYESMISPIINIIGFDVDSEGQNQLIKMAEETDGIYQGANDENELKKELNKISEIAAAWESWKKQSEQQLDYQRVSNDLDIFVYITTEEYNASFERLEIENILYTFKQNGKMDNDSLQYLLDRNREYHNWIRDEVAAFKAELKSMNEKSYSEAKKALEQKYKNSNP